MDSWRPRQLTVAQLQERRQKAAALFRNGQLTDAQIARVLGVGRSAMCAWHQAYRHGGVARLSARPRTGRPSRLSPRQWRQLERLIERGARAAGFDTERFTLRRITQLVEQRFHVRYHPRSLERPLKARGFSVQRPVSVARERDEYVIAHWPTREWVALKKRPIASTARSSWWTRRGTACRARTASSWARRGHPPILKRLSRRREISSIVGITPDGALAARHYTGSIQTRTVIATLRYFYRRFNTALLIVWDRLNAHRSDALQRFLARHPERFAVAYLPAYAPELNPEEPCNAWVKQQMLNTTVASLKELAALARRHFRRLQRRPAMIRSFFHHAGLSVH